MAKSLIDSVYDIYLRKSGKGQLYEVPITVEENGESRTEDIYVWAISVEQAEQRAVELAREMSFRQIQKEKDKYMGVLLPKKHYKPKSVLGAIASPMKVWKDPVYKKGASNIFSSSGYKAGTMTRLSISHLFKHSLPNGDTESLTFEYLSKAIKVNIFSIFIWIGLTILGVLFLVLGFSAVGQDRFFFSWLNPFMVAGVACLLLGLLATFKSVKDYFWIIRRMDILEMESNEEAEVIPFHDKGEEDKDG